MGRPKIDEPKQQYTVMLKPSTVAEIDRLSAIRGRFSRSEMMSNLIDQGIEDLQHLDKLGLLQSGGNWRQSMEEIKRGITVWRCQTG